jgi:signal transduction histidine kinase
MGLRWLGAVLLLLALGDSCARAATPKRLLILDSFGRDIAPFNKAVSALRTTLARELGEPVDIYEASLDAARFAEPEKEAPFVEFLKFRFEGRPVDLLVPVGAPAVRFASKHRDTLFANTSILFMGVDPRILPSNALRTNATLVTQRVNLPGAIEDMLQIQPATTNIVVIFGASPLEKFWVKECRREFEAFTNRVAFTWFDDLPLDRIMERVAALPPRSFIMFGMLVVDASGVPYDNDEALRQLHKAARAPVFGYFASEFGMGTIGGRLYQDSEVGMRTARAAIRILHGERPENIPPQILETAAPVYDWRELNRWGISEAQLPLGSEIRFRERGLWQEHRWQILGIFIVCLAQTGLIILLVVHRARRRQAEANALDLGRRLVNAQEEERTRIARELHDDISQRMALLAIDAGTNIGPSTGRNLKQGLAQLSEDIHALSYRLHPSVLEDLGLGEALRMECERVAGNSSLTVNVNITEGCARPAREVALCLFRVAQEALRNIIRHACARVVRISLRPLEEGLQLIVADDGVGFETNPSRERPSLGLSSMRERVQLLGGALEIDSAPGQGTTVLAWVPATRKFYETRSFTAG